MTSHTCAWCSRWTSYCNGRGKCCLGSECPVISIDPCNPTLDATGWTAGSDVQVIAKGKRIRDDEADFRRRILAKDAGEPEKSRSRMRSGPMPGTRASGLKRGFNGRVTRREV